MVANVALNIDDAWLSLVERCVRDAEVAGSNPVASMKRKFHPWVGLSFHLFLQYLNLYSNVSRQSRNLPQANLFNILLHRNLLFQLLRYSLNHRLIDKVND